MGSALTFSRCGSGFGRDCCRDLSCGLSTLLRVSGFTFLMIEVGSVAGADGEEEEEE